MKIAIQGIEGSNHDIVAKNYFGSDITVCDCRSFPEMFELLVKNKVDYITMAIENSIAGGILPNYALLDEYNFKIIGEVYQPIAHHLMALPDQSITAIKEVWSHPMAINQCRQFFRNHADIKLIETEDTAASAKKIAQKNIKGVAAIAAEEASKIFGLQLLHTNIQTNSENYTRFFIVSKESENDDDVDKASIKFITKHQKGSLSEVLQLFVQYDLNLTKIQSLPVIHEPWQYAFFTDIIFDEKAQFDNMIEALKKVVTEVKILGIYKHRPVRG